MTSTEGGAGWGAVRRHVVKHDWRSIRDALFVGRNEHMSDVDDCVSHLLFDVILRQDESS